MERYSLPTAICQRCGYRWHPRITRKPRKCPNCTSNRWSEPRELKVIEHVSHSEGEDDVVILND